MTRSAQDREAPSRGQGLPEGAAARARKTNWFSLGALALFLLFSATVLDTCAGVLDPGRPFRVVRGGSAAVSGDLGRAPEVETGFEDIPPETVAELLEYEVSSVDLTLSFTMLKGRLWTGSLTANQQAEPGEYTVRVKAVGIEDSENEPLHAVRIFPDQAALTADLPTVSERHLGVKPMLLTLAMLPFALFALYLSFVRGGREVERIEASGMGPIYKLAKGKKEWEIIVGLGRKHGVVEGAALAVLNKRMLRVGSLVARQVSQEFSHATLDLGADIRPDYLVVLEPAVTSGGAEQGTGEET